MHLPAAADGLHGVVLGDLKPQRRQIKDLACFAHIRKGQLLLTGVALVGYTVDNDFVGLRGLAQGAAGVTLLSTCWPLAGNTQGLRRGPVQAVTRWWLAGVAAAHVESRLHLLDRLLQHRDLPLQHQNQRILFGMAQLVQA